MKHGEVINYSKDYNGGKKDRVVFAAPIKIDVENYFVAVVVEINKINNSFYLHEVALQNKKEDNAPFKTGSRKKSSPSGATSSIYSLLEDLQNVNSNSMQDKPKFSLKETVEETKDLIAVHNLTQDKLLKSINLGGLPMPSIAIMKANNADNNSDYGDISLVFPKSAIDPQENKLNKIYGGDVWSPVYPTIEYKLNEKKAGTLYTRVKNLTKKSYAYKINPVKFAPVNIEYDLDTKGENGLIDMYKNDYGMKQLYLAETAEPVSDVITKETRTELTPEDIKMYDYLLEHFNEPLSKFSKGSYPKRRWFKEHAEEFNNIRREYYKLIMPDITENQLNNIFEHEDETIVANLAQQIGYYKANGSVKVTVKNDNDATQKEIDSRINQKEYEAWLADLFSGITEKSGIRNNVDPYTSSGNRRSFEQLHYENTLENVVEQMKSQENGDIAMFSGQGIWAVAAKSYGTLSDVKADSSRLKNMSEAEFGQIRSGFADRLAEIVTSLDSKYKHDNEFMNIDIKITNILESVKYSKTKTGMLTFLKKYFKNATESTVEDILNLVSDIGNMPTGYFEAKPQRAVYFNEVYIAVIPDNSSKELMDSLEDSGIQYKIYEAGNSKQRVDILNSIDNIKFSIKEQPIDYNAILEENEELSEMNEDLKQMLELTSAENEKLKNEFKITDKHNNSNNAVDKVAVELRKQYSSNYGKSELVSRLSGLYDYIANAGTDIDMGYIWSTATGIAKNIIDNSVHKDTTIYDEYKELRNRIRNTQIRVPETVKSGFDNYESFRRSNFGRLRLSNDGIELDSFYTELASEYPEFFEAGVAEEQQLEALANFFSSTSPIYYNASEEIADSMGYNMEQYSNLIAGDIFDKYFDVPEVLTAAEKHKKEIDTLKMHYRNQISEMRQSYKERYEERLKEIKEANKQRISKLRADKAEALAKQKAHFEDVGKNASERRKKSKLRASIRKSLKKIAALGANPNKKKHIPNAIIDSVKALADAVTLDNSLKQDQQLSLRLNEFRNGFERVSNNTQYSIISEMYNDYIYDKIIELQQRAGEKTITELSVQDLEDINELLKMTVQSINNINRLFLKNRSETIEVYANKISEELAPFKKENIRNGITKSLAYNSMKPEYFFRYIGSETLLDLYHDLRKGEDTWAVDISEARDYALEIRKKYGWQKWDSKETQKFETIDGEIELTLQERLGIFANSLGEHTKNHLYSGGFVYQKPKAKGIKELSKQRNDNSSYRLSIEDVEKIVDSLTAEQCSYVRDMIKYLSSDMAQKGNEITRELYDIDLFKESTYYPAKVNKEATHQSSKEVRAEKQIKNAGFTNATVKDAKQPLVLMDFDDVWASHVDEMSKYHAFVLPLENIDRVYNLYDVSPDYKYTSIKQGIKDAYGEKAITYIDDLIKDINGGVVQEAGTDIISRLTSKFKKNAVFASASVAIQQPSAIGRALSEIDAKYFVQTTGSGFNRKSYDEMKKYAPVAIIKEMGYFDTNMAQNTVDFLNNNDYNSIKEKAKAFVKDSSYRDEVLSFFASKADEITWTHIWNACKRETKAKYSNLNEEQMLEKAGERFTEVITKTQVYDSVFSRSGLMRSRDSGVKNAMAFMAEPTTSLNMLIDATIQAKRGTISKAKKWKVFSSLMVASVLNSLLQSVVTAARADDDDKDWLEVYLAQLIPNFIDNINPLNQIAVWQGKKWH